MSMNEHDDKQAGDPGISGLWQEADHPEPPAGLDRRILAAAHQAASQARPRKQGWWRLAVPFSATAVLVLAVTMLLRVEREAPQMLHDAAPTEMRQAPAAAEMETPAGMGAPGAPMPAAKPRPEKRSAVGPSEPASQAERGDRAQAPDALMAPPEPAPPGAMEADRRDSSVAAPAPMLRQQSHPAASLELGKSKAEGEVMDDPAGMVERIRRLLAEGRRDEALRVIAELRRRHPDYPLPADLQALR